MAGRISNQRGYLLAAALGAVGGGLAVALATRAVPRIVSQAMASAMQRMTAGMAEPGCDPAEL